MTAVDRNATIHDRASLRAIRARSGLDAVVVETARLSHRNLLPCALKYALWAVRPGGTISIVGEDRTNAAPPAYTVSLNLIRQWTFKFIGAECCLASSTENTLVLERTAPVLSPGWSAGVVFSGSDGEIPTLRACLQGLMRQPELLAENGGEIVVCGPARDLEFLTEFPQVRYLEYANLPGPRFLIGRKKNALMAAMTNPRMVVLHARIVLDAGALSRVPAEFDISGPSVRVATATGEQSYLSFFQSDATWPGASPERLTLGLRDIPSGEPLALMERGGVFVDGGAFYITRAAFEACPLHPEIAWEEGEDVEWCSRAFALGFLVELTPESGGVSQSNKLKDWSKLGGLERPLRLGMLQATAMRAGLKHHLARLMGKR